MGRRTFSREFKVEAVRAVFELIESEGDSATRG